MRTNIERSENHKDICNFENCDRLANYRKLKVGNCHLKNTKYEYCAYHRPKNSINKKFPYKTIFDQQGIGGSNPIFPQDTPKFGFGDGQKWEKWGKKYMEREGSKLPIFKIEKIPIFPHDAPKFGFGDGKKCEKWGKKYMEREGEVFVLTNCFTLLSLFSAF